MKCRIPEEEKKKLNASVNLSMYEMNQQIIAQLPPFDFDSDEKQTLVEKYDDFLNRINNKYYMLLCKELSYFTLFKRTGNEQAEDMWDVLLEIFNSYGTFITYSWTEDENALEFWIKIKEPTEEDENHEVVHAFLFFGYDAGLVEVN